MKDKLKIDFSAAGSITISVLKQHIKFLDKTATEAYYTSFSADGDAYNEAIHAKMFLEEALDYFEGSYK